MMFNTWECKDCGAFCNSGHDHDILDCEYQRTKNAEKKDDKMTEQNKLDGAIDRFDPRKPYNLREEDGVLIEKAARAYHKIKPLLERLQITEEILDQYENPKAIDYRIFKFNSSSILKEISKIMQEGGE